MPRSRAARWRYLEGVVGYLGEVVEVRRRGLRFEGDDEAGWRYVVRCRTCLADEPEWQQQRRGDHHPPPKLKLSTSSTTEMVEAWLEHVAACHPGQAADHGGEEVQRG
jgi:hypothetical protein